jgi:hypothetical protein
MKDLPDFYGSGLDLESAEILTVARIDRTLLAEEPALMQSKWFDYRQLHPAVATHLLVHHYNLAYGDFIGRALDHKLRFTKAIKGGDFFEHHERKSFWKLRQLIDRLGMRYEFFLREAMSYLIEQGWGKGVPHPPRPAHLTADNDLIVAVCNAWTLEGREKIQWAASSRFRVEQWCAAPDQQAYQAHLIESIRRRPVRRFALSAALHTVGHLRLEAALEHFADDLDEAIDFSLQNSLTRDL